MSTENQNPSGITSAASGASNLNGNNGSNPSGNEPKDTVAYETHRKLLSEKKTLQERLEKLEADQKALEEKKLKENNEWQAIAKLKEEEAKKAREEALNLKQGLEAGLKMSAILRAIDGDIEEQFYPLVDTSKIVINPETGLPDPSSVDAYAKEFVTKYGKVISRNDGINLPNQAPRDGAAQLISEAQWLKLPVKEQKKQVKNVIEFQKYYK